MIKNMKLGTKLGLGFGIVVVLMIGIVIFSILNFSKLDAGVDLVVQDRYPKTVMANDIIASINTIARTVRNMVIMTKQADIEKGAETIKAAGKIIDDRLDNLSKVLQSEKGKELLASIKASRKAYVLDRDEAIKLALDGKKQEAAEVVIDKMRPLQLAYMENVKKLIGFQHELMEEAGKAAKQTYNSARTVTIMVSIISVLLACILAFWITRSITRPINRVVSGLSDGAEQVAAASGQVSSASQSLAEGASEQAAGLEETSASIEELTSMTKQNAEYSGHADKLMRDTTKVVDDANQAMKELTLSMGEISSASEETGKIVKTIDEIAFQTNLLALNAAVEAARAGEAGAGFAVVADEVRNLAMRAAEAAKNTSSLIEGTVKKIKIGSDIVGRTNAAFEKVAGGSRKSAELVGEIAAASREQAQGIDQINKAIAEMDKVVQQNSASAEESASAAEEMNAQAEEMKSFVAELIAVIGGNGHGNGYHKAKALPAGNGNGKRVMAVNRQLKSSVTNVHSKLITKGNGRKPSPISGFKKIRPEQLIPLGDADFSEF